MRANAVLAHLLIPSAWRYVYLLYLLRPPLCPPFEGPGIKRAGVPLPTVPRSTCGRDETVNSRIISRHFRSSSSSFFRATTARAELARMAECSPRCPTKDGAHGRLGEGRARASARCRHILHRAWLPTSIIATLVCPAQLYHPQTTAGRPDAWWGESHAPFLLPAHGPLRRLRSATH